MTDKSTELWATLPELQNRYEVSNMGRVRNTKSGYILSQTMQARGYFYVTLTLDNNKTVCRRVNRLVAKCFVSNPEPITKNMVHHIDGDKLNNKASNLAWVTRSENMREYFKDHKGHKWTQEQRIYFSNLFKGRKLSEETRKKLSEAHKGRKVSEETREKLRNRIISEETRKKLSEANKGRHHSAETKAKIGKAHKGKQVSAETRAKMSKAQKGRHHSVETREKISAGHARRRAKLEALKANTPPYLNYIDGVD